MIHGAVARARPDRQTPSRHTTVLLGISIAAAAAGGLLAGSLASANRTFALPAVLVLALPFVAWRRLTLAVIGLAFMALVVEQYRIGVPGGDLTDHVPLFTSLSDGFSLSGVYINPMEILLAIVLLVLLVRAGQRRALLPRTPVALSLVALLGLVVAGAVHGVGTGGDYKMALWEIRPFIYVAVMYLLAAQLPASVNTVTALLWAFVAAVAIKSVQGLYLVLTAILGGHQLGDYLLSHEDSVFFVLFLVLVVALWVFRYPGALRRVSTALLPVVLIVDLANNRRTSWLQLGACFIVLLLLVCIRLPDRRRLAVGLLAGVTAAMAIYLPLYWDRTGLLGQPARAIQSTFAPNSRDASSDLYRQAENANLQINLMRSPLFGVGYGIPIDYVVPIVDLSRTDPFIKFIPHNNLLYIWMRLGAIGALAFWSFIGLVILSACRLLRAPDLRLALYGSLVICAVINYLIMGYLDLGLFWFRVAIFMGCLFGVLEVARRAQQAEERRLLVAVRESSGRLAPLPIEAKAAVGTGVALAVATPEPSLRRMGLSADRNWWWNGDRWVRAVTEDGLWRWDGRRWQPMADFVDKSPSDVVAALSRLAEDRYARAGAILAAPGADWQPEADRSQVMAQANRITARLQRIESTLRGLNGTGRNHSTPPTPETARRSLEWEGGILGAKLRPLLIEVARAAPQPTIKQADDELEVARALEERAASIGAALAEAAEAERARRDAVTAAQADLAAAQQARQAAIEHARKALQFARSVPRLGPKEVRARRLLAMLGSDHDEYQTEFGGLRLRSAYLATPVTQLPLAGLRAHAGIAQELWVEHRQALADLVLLESPESLSFFASLIDKGDGLFILLVGSTGAALWASPPGQEEAARRFAGLVDQRAAAAELQSQRRDAERRAAEQELEAVAGRRASIDAAEAKLRESEVDPGLLAAIDAARLRLEGADADAVRLLRARRRIQEVMDLTLLAPEPISAPSG
jgi:O-antigen ligase/polysaccharide polymerase Wzy-like membrane protein